MAKDPRTFTVKTNCPQFAQGVAIETGRKKGFLDNITNLGNLEVLNDIGAGKVGEGLRVLAAVSDSVRTGQSVVPGREGSDTVTNTIGKIAGTALDAVNEGAETVLDTVGLGGAVEAVGKLNTGAANRAYAQAENIYDRVKRGNFSLSDIPEVFSDLQNLETLARGIFGGDGLGDSKRDFEMCSAAPYAMDLIAFAPKFQFMFIVEIQMAPEYQDWSDIGQHVAFVVKTSDRPKFNVDYEEINMYGFRTRVPKRIEYQPINMSFYDDNKNMAHMLYVAYMRAMSPVANWKNESPQDGSYERSGMAFDRAPSTATYGATSPATSGHSASLGPLVGKTTSIFQSIKLHHIYNYGDKMNTYNFYNPRITAFNPSSLTMAETGEGTSYDFDFVYDGLYIQHELNLSEHVSRLKAATGFGKFPIDPVFGSEGSESGYGHPTADQAEENAPQSGFLGGFADGLASAAEGITDAFGNVIGGVGDGISSAVSFAGDAFGGFTDAAGDALGAAGTGLTKVTSGIGGAIANTVGAGQKAIGGLGNTISNAFRDTDALDQQSKAVNEAFNGGSDLSPEGKKLFGLS